MSRSDGEHIIWNRAPTSCRALDIQLASADANSEDVARGRETRSRDLRRHFGDFFFLLRFAFSSKWKMSDIFGLCRIIESHLDLGEICSL